MRYTFQILILSITLSASAQDVIKQFRTDKKIRNDKEFIKEFQSLSIKLLDSLEINLNNWDSIFIIRGVDITSRTGYGLVWKKDLRIDYVDNKKLSKNKRFLEPAPQFKINQDAFDFEDFRGLLPYIERWDTSYVIKFVKAINIDSSILSGIYWWQILKLNKGEKSFYIEQFWVPNFAVFKQ